MTMEGRATVNSSASSVSAPALERLESADFVRIVTRADGDGLAAAGLLARTLTDRETPFQVTVGETIGDRTARLQPSDDRMPGTVSVAIGPHDVDVDADPEGADIVSLETETRPATLAAAELARDLEGSPDPVLTLAGTIAAGIEPGAGESEWVLESALESDRLERRPGVGVPTADVIDGLTASMGCLAPWSGDEAAVVDALEEIGLGVDVDVTSNGDGNGDGNSDAIGPNSDSDLDPDPNTHRTIGSAVALDVVGDDDASEYAATAIGRFLRPYAITDGRPFATLEGYADVLAATAALEAGTGVALAMGHEARKPALEAWRTCGRRVHAALDDASTGRYDGLFVVDVGDAPVRPAARLVLAYRSPEPAVLALGDGEAALATRDASGFGPTLEAVARDLEIGAAYDVGRRGGTLRYGDCEQDNETVIAAVRGHL
ncbi:exonuclease [Natronosalvus halobius]|uniref:exonuclease n=1 Tax=Natronosalvus halobius TaxID=2953746 RepID=UPI00209E8F72|nr:exonuclease [Natronosalvus halobius]USZ73222.1 exonuclease [Natronosalvus halobius]